MTVRHVFAEQETPGGQWIVHDGFQTADEARSFRDDYRRRGHTATGVVVFYDPVAGSTVEAITTLINDVAAFAAGS